MFCHPVRSPTSRVSWDNDQMPRSAASSGPKGRARRVPDEAVAREVSRSLLDSTAGIATWLDARGPRHRGDLTRKRSVVQVHVAPPVPSRQPSQTPPAHASALLTPGQGCRSSKLVMRVRFSSPAPPKSAGHSPGNGAAAVPGSACGPSSCHICATWAPYGAVTRHRSRAWLPAVPGHGASLNGGYRSVTRTNA